MEKLQVEKLGGCCSDVTQQETNRHKVIYNSTFCMEDIIILYYTRIGTVYIALTYWFTFSKKRERR